ncbi:MAG: NADPH:quinone oxidoreductase family protein [Pseudomonadales bacterium]|nr:NADPH:quinone oxidoreductase family protein [Pseudomonadales bacterium]
MKAVICEAYGDHHGLVVKDLPAPQAPGPDEVQIDIKARGIAFSDLVRIAGDYQDVTEPPFVVGGEGAGTITAVGAEIETLKTGDKVLCRSGCIETINVAASAVTALPDEIDFEAAAAYGSNYMTAYQGLTLANIQQGETLLVHGAAGGVGLAAVDLGKIFGARVIATASSDEKLNIVKELGADETINYSDGFREQVKALTAGLGADVIYDPVGGDVFDESMRCIAPFGRILIVGFTSGRAALAKTNHLLVKNASVIGYSIGSLRQFKPTLYKQYDDTLMDLLANKRITPYVSHRFAMDNIVEAYQVLVDRKVIGKVIIK